MKKRSAVAGFAAVAVFATAVYAATFDPATGFGFVGKGEVQEPWGWNNREMSQRAANVEFSYSQEVTYQQECLVTTMVANPPGPATPVVVQETQTRNGSINKSLSFEQRRNGGNGNFTGFILNGFGPGSPIPTDICTGNNATIYNGSLVTIVSQGPLVLKADSEADGAFEIEISY
jgi:hypothetical protein